MASTGPAAETEDTSALQSETGNSINLKAQDWLISHGLRTSDIATTLSQCCVRMLAAGVPPWRAHLAYSTLQPLYASQSIIWTRTDGVDDESHAHGVNFDGWLKSPLKFIIDNELPYLHRRCNRQRR